MTNARPCPTCGEPPSEQPALHHGYFVTCSDCQDMDCIGDPPQLINTAPIGWGPTIEEAVTAWNEALET